MNRPIRSALRTQNATLDGPFAENPITDASDAMFIHSCLRSLCSGAIGLGRKSKPKAIVVKLSAASSVCFPFTAGSTVLTPSLAPRDDNQLAVEPKVLSILASCCCFIHQAVGKGVDFCSPSFGVSDDLSVAENDGVTRGNETERGVCKEDFEHACRLI